MKIKVRVERKTEFEGEFEGDTVEECIGQAEMEARAHSYVIESKTSLVVGNKDQLGLFPGATSLNAAN
jgi:hypothetical protein